MSHIFISYSHLDKAYVHKLHQHLYERGFDAWIDDRLDYGSHWPKEIEKRLIACEVFILIMSPNSNESDWVQAELAYARKLKKKIYTLLLDGEVWWHLGTTQYIDVRKGEMPPENFFISLAQVPQKPPENEKPNISVHVGGNVDGSIVIGNDNKVIAENAAREKAEQEAVEKARLEAEESAKQEAAKEKVEREEAEKVAREKAEQEAAEKARLEAEEQARQKAAKEKEEREAAEQAAREKVEQEAVEKARLEAEENAIQKAAKEKAEREAAEMDAREKARNRDKSKDFSNKSKYEAISWAFGSVIFIFLILLFISSN